MIDKDFVKRKIILIQRDLGRLKEFEKMTFDDVAKDWQIYGLVKNLLMEVIGRAIDINQHVISETSKPEEGAPLDYTQTFSRLVEAEVFPEEFGKKIAKSAGFRNAIVHGYNDVDQHIVYASIGDAVSQYTQYCDYVLDFIKKSEK